MATVRVSLTARDQAIHHLGGVADFMTADIKPSETISVFPGPVKLFGHTEDFRPRIVEAMGGKRRSSLKQRRLLLSCFEIDAKIERTSSHYSHENTCRLNADYRDHKNHIRITALFRGWMDDVEYLRYELCKAIYRELEESYNDQTSDEQLIETAEANMYWFAADAATPSTRSRSFSRRRSAL